jgi:hypothetical protein
MWRKVGLFAVNFILMAAASWQSLTLACPTQYEQNCDTYNTCPWGCTVTTLSTYKCCCTRSAAVGGGCCAYTCAWQQCSGWAWCYGTQTARTNGIVKYSPAICYGNGSCY